MTNPCLGLETSDPGRGGGPLGTLSVTSPFERKPKSTDGIGKKTKARNEAVGVTGSKNSAVEYSCGEDENGKHDPAASCVAT